MSMISKLVDKLREIERFYDSKEEFTTCFGNYGSNELGDIINRAANVIEELSAKLHNADMERSSMYFNGGWIPCYEHFPDIEVDVLLITKEIGVNLGFMSKTGRFYVYKNGGTYLETDDVTAWRPLPKPYREN